MKIKSITKKELVLVPSNKDENSKSFVFEIGIIPDKPKPKALVIQKETPRRVISWSMTWIEFLNQTCIGDVVIIPKAKFWKVIRMKT